MATKGKKIKVTLMKSPIGYNASQRDVLRGLGLRKLNRSVELINSPEVRGMINKVIHLVAYEVGS